MKVLFLGDIVGRAGRAVVTGNVPRLRKQLSLDFVIANGENAAHGFGINRKICDELFDAGIDVITGGNHSWDQIEAAAFIDEEPRLLRPENFQGDHPGRGHGVFTTASGLRVLIVNVLCRLFMDLYDNPFPVLDRLVADANPSDAGFDAVIVDVHGEASSEKAIIGHVLDGRASLVVGTHTHVPTADARILAGGTGFQTDAGMCGDYDSVIGMDKAAAVGRMLGEIPRPRLSPADGEATLCGVVVETEPKTGLAKSILPIRIGGALSTAWPS
ncbi:MAG: TIGR00282 family metallophosphoesterase [Alphaproteobacteria bacterium]